MKIKQKKKNRQQKQHKGPKTKNQTRTFLDLPETGKAIR